MVLRRLVHGSLNLGLFLALLAACSGDPGSSDAPCTGPSCGGSDPCAGVVCDAPGTCQSGPGECVDGACVYAPRNEGACDDPPDAMCSSDSTLQVYTSPGVCEAGECVYPSQTTECSLGCEGGACAGDPCADIPCDSPPGGCFAANGSCQNGVCSYSVVAGGACDDGDPCTANDVCGASGACAGTQVDCQSPPKAVCESSTTLTVYDATGACDGAGQCSYDSTDVQCAEGCANGACKGDPCAGIVCDAPPTACHQAAGLCESGVCVYEFDNGAYCADGDACTEQDSCYGGVCAGTAKVCNSPDAPACIDATTLRVWVSPGQCEGSGQCVYDPADVICAWGCENGACIGDPCAGITCDDPGPAECLGANVLQTPTGQGTCSGGACSYETTQSTCDYGCSLGACQAPTGLVISEFVVDSSGFPDTESFVELHGPAGLSVDGLTLVGVNGNGGAVYATVQLVGNLGADGLFVVAHPAATGAVAQVADMIEAAIDFQNGPDSIQLRFGNVVLDAVAYGTFGAGDVAAGEGTPVVMHKVGESLHRDDSFTDTDNNAADFAPGAPTPGAANVDTSCDTVLNPGCDCINGTTQACGSDVGACEFGNETCTDGAWSACTGGVGPVDEVCGNQLDDNCDGVVDEGCGPEDVFTLGTCGGTAMTPAEALAKLGSANRIILASATIRRRLRSCGTCDWGNPSDWIIHYLTYSGGVTTRYLDLPATMNLVLFKDGSTPRFSIQHTTFAGSTYDDYDGMLYGFPPAVIPYPHVRAYNHFPSSQYDYRELDYQVKDGTVGIGDRCLQWVADPYGSGGPPYTMGYGVIFRWD